MYFSVTITGFLKNTNTTIYEMECIQHATQNGQHWQEGKQTDISVHLCFFTLKFVLGGQLTLPFLETLNRESKAFMM